MYHFVFKNYRYPSSNTTLDFSLIMRIAPSAKIYECGKETNFLHEIFKFWYSENLTVVEVEDEEEAQRLIDRDDRGEDLVEATNHWSRPKLWYVFKDLKRERLDNDAIMLKLSGKGAVHVEAPEVSSKSYGQTHVVRKMRKFVSDTNMLSSHVSDEFIDAVKTASDILEKEVAEFRDERMKAKKEANKLKTSLRGKLMRFAVVKKK